MLIYYRERFQFNLKQVLLSSNYVNPYSPSSIFVYERYKMNKRKNYGMIGYEYVPIFEIYTPEQIKKLVDRIYSEWLASKL